MNPDPIREQSLERSLPNSSEAERAILGGIILDNGIMQQAIEMLRPEDFYVPNHRRIFCAMIELFEQHAEINPIIIGNALKRHNELESVGGISFITNLTYGLPHSTNIRHYAQVVREKETLRWIIKESSKVVQQALEGEDEPAVILAQVIERFSETQSESAVKSQKGGRLSDFVAATEDYLYTLRAGINPAISTGLQPLDTLTSGGILPGQLWGIGALSSKGKTSLLLQMLRHMAKAGTPVALFSLEKRIQAAVLRVLASETDVPRWKIRFGMKETNLDYLIGQVSKKFDLPLYVYEDCRSIADIVGRIKTLKRALAAQGQALRVVGIDYYGLISGYGRGRDRYENKTQELKYISTALQQQIANDEKVGLIVPAQFNRSGWSATDAGPANIDGGEAFFQACDLFARLDSKDPKRGETTADASLKVFKQSDGPKGTVNLEFHADKMEFFSRIQDEGEEYPDEPEKELHVR